MSGIATQLTADMTLADIEERLTQYKTLLQQSNLNFSDQRLREDMIRRVAEKNGITPEQWMAGQQTAPVAPEPEPEPEQPKPKARGYSIDRSYFFIPDDLRQKAEMAIKLNQAGEHVHALIIGPTGSGKTEFVRNVAEQFGLPFYKVDCPAITTPDKWVGHKEVEVTENGPKTTYVLSEHLRWLAAETCEPGILLYDEITRVNPVLNNTLLPILDRSGEIWVPDLNIYSKIHEKTIIFATANIGSQYTGTYALDPAVHDRFGLLIEMRFPPEKEEIEVVMRRTGVDEAQARQMVAVAIQARIKASGDNPSLSFPISTRSLVDWGKLVHVGMPLVEAADSSVVLKFSAEGGSNSERALVQNILGAVLGSKKK